MKYLLFLCFLYFTPLTDLNSQNVWMRKTVWKMSIQYLEEIIQALTLETRWLWKRNKKNLKKSLKD